MEKQPNKELDWINNYLYHHFCKQTKRNYQPFARAEWAAHTKAAHRRAHPQQTRCNAYGRNFYSVDIAPFHRNRLESWQVAAETLIVHQENGEYPTLLSVWGTSTMRTGRRHSRSLGADRSQPVWVGWPFAPGCRF